MVFNSVGTLVVNSPADEKDMTKSKIALEFLRGRKFTLTFRHGHQLIFLIKVELFWYSEMKIRSWEPIV